MECVDLGPFLTRSLRILILLVCFAFPFAGATNAQETCLGGTCDSIGAVESMTVRIGYTQFSPYSGTSSAGVADGYMIDLLRLLLEPLGYSLQFVAHENPSELLESLRRGEIDITSPLSINDERKAFGHFSDAVHTYSFGVFVKSGGNAIEAFSDLDGKRVAVARGSQADRLLRDIDGAIAVPFENSNELLLPLLTGEVDAVAAPVASLLFNMRRAGLGARVVLTDVSIRQSPAGFLVDPARPILLEELNKSIQEAKSKGYIENLYDQWFGAVPEPFSRRESLAALLASVTVMVALLYWGWLHYGVRKRANSETERANSLQEVLNATGATLLIADKDMKPVWWNEAYAKNYPRRMPLLTSGATLRELLAHSEVDLDITEDQDLEVAQEMFQEQMDVLSSGGEIQSIDIVSEGRVLRSRSTKLPSGQYGVIATDVTALTAAHAELEANAERLVEANRDLSEFSHVAAHDLAGPLRNIRNLHRWILEDMTDNGVRLEGEILENFEHIDRLIGRQSALIDDLLAYSRSEGQSTPRAFQPQARLASILDLCNVPPGFHVSTPEEMPDLLADPIGFDIVMRNLISNAAKHHDRSNGEVRVTCAIQGETARITVTDDGPGIEKQYLNTIFQPFRTLKSRDHGGGTGLGLAFVERTVGKWGGQVTVTSDPDKRKTAFSFTVPLNKSVKSHEKIVRLRTG